jgi:drug/metabolite transporter (DMT)-like permease
VLTVILGFATSLVYGFADFFGAIAARRINAVLVTFLSGVSGLLFLLSLTPALGASFDQETLFWGISAGVASAFAMTCLYASLAIGPISIVSPLGAVVSAIVPAAVGFALGERFGWIGWIALGVILVAVVLVGFMPGEAVRLPSAKGLSLGIAAGSGIGVVLICLAMAPNESGLGPVILLRSVSAGILGGLLLIRIIASKAKNAGNAGDAGNAKTFTLTNGKVERKFWLAVIVAGLFDSSANVFFLLAARVPDGTLTVVSVLTALYPLGTIILARLVLKERIALVQQIGIGLALGGSVLLALN